MWDPEHLDSDPDPYMFLSKDPNIEHLHPLIIYILHMRFKSPTVYLNFFEAFSSMMLMHSTSYFGSRSKIESGFQVEAGFRSNS